MGVRNLPVEKTVDPPSPRERAGDFEMRVAIVQSSPSLGKP